MTLFALGIIVGILLSILNVLYFKPTIITETKKKVSSLFTNQQAKIISTDDPIESIEKILK